MLQELLAHARRFLSSVTLRPEQAGVACRKPIWNKSDEFNALWKEHVAEDPPRVLGTASAARALLDEVQRVFAKKMSVVSLPFSERRYCKETDGLREHLKKFAPDAIVGDTNDVSYLFGKQLCIGYVLERDECSGLTRETIESLDQRLSVLRLDGKIIAAYPSTIMRMESRGGVHIV